MKDNNCLKTAYKTLYKGSRMGRFMQVDNYSNYKKLITNGKYKLPLFTKLNSYGLSIAIDTKEGNGDWS